jgi:hypothetical protein
MTRASCTVCGPWPTSTSGKRVPSGSARPHCGEKRAVSVSDDMADTCPSRKVPSSSRSRTASCGPQRGASTIMRAPLASGGPLRPTARRRRPCRKSLAPFESVSAAPWKSARSNRSAIANSASPPVPRDDGELGLTITQLSDQLGAVAQRQEHLRDDEVERFCQCSLEPRTPVALEHDVDASRGELPCELLGLRPFVIDEEDASHGPGFGRGDEGSQDIASAPSGLALHLRVRSTMGLAPSLGPRSRIGALCRGARSARVPFRCQCLSPLCSAGRGWGPRRRWVVPGGGATDGRARTRGISTAPATTRGLAPASARAVRVMVRSLRPAVPHTSKRLW